jgi:amidase
MKHIVRFSYVIAAIAFLSACTNTSKITNNPSTAFDDAWLSATANEQAQAIKSGELSAYALTKAYLARIEMLDRQGPRVQAVLSINPDALTQAKQADLDVLNNKTLGALHGIPILVKDNIETSELATTAGSLALLSNKTNRDAPIIAKLKAQGAIILGKTNLSEWANFRSNDSVSGWSAIGGQTRNPHSLERTPCGSSSGSGAAIASRMAPLAIGTETNGSIICPSAMNGVVGVKPTVGMLSRTHIVPISVTQDTAGPMTRSVKDAALMLSAMAGNDPQDPATANANQYATDFAAELDKSIKGKKIGVFKAVQSDHPEIIAAFEKASKQLEAMGAELVVIDTFETPENFWTNALNVLLIEFKHELNKYLASTPKSVESRTLEDLIAFNQNNEREFAIFDQSLFLQAQDTNGYDEEYKTALAFLRNATRTNGIDKLLKDYDVDAIIMPSQTPAFLIESVYGDSFAGGFAGAGWLAAIAGYPHVSVPMGQMKGLPINLSFIAGQWDDAMLLNIAYQYEQASQQLIEPTFPASAIEHPYFKDKLVPLEL